jgi:hypothetical protein
MREINIFDPFFQLALICGVRLHPGLLRDACEPVCDCRDEAGEVLSDMLFCDDTDRDCLSVRIDQDMAKDFLGLKDAQGVVTQGTMPERGLVGFGCVEPIMDSQIVVWLSTEPFG